VNQVAGALAWDGYWPVIAGMLLLFLVGAGMALGILAGRPLGGPAVVVVIGFSFLVTITVVIALFIARSGGNAATAVAFGGVCGACGDQHDQGRRHLAGHQCAQADGQRPGPRMSVTPVPVDRQRSRVLRQAAAVNACQVGRKVRSLAGRPALPAHPA
jgi:hypothetical protein